MAGAPRPAAARVGQVRGATGFAMFRAPAPDATLDTVINGGGVAQIRDPDRRLLTMVEWDAVPDWAISATDLPMDAATGEASAFDAKAGALPDPLHAATLGGFDLHELDIDDLSSVDAKTGKVKDEKFSMDTQVWRRSAPGRPRTTAARLECAIDAACQR